MSDVNCPYCNHKIEINHDDGYGYKEYKIHNQECSNCGKTFVYKTLVIYHYEVGEAPCLNGGEHKLKDIYGVPKEFFVGKKICECCGQEFMINKEANDRAMEQYLSKNRGS